MCLFLFETQHWCVCVCVCISERFTDDPAIIFVTWMFTYISYRNCCLKASDSVCMTNVQTQ